MKRLRINIFEKDTGVSLKFVPVTIEAETFVSESFSSGTTVPGGVITEIIASMMSNHLGYLSIDLSIPENKKVRNVIVKPIFDNHDKDDEFLINLNEINNKTVYPLKLKAKDRPNEKPNFSLPSFFPQPDIDDWLISPGSFGSTEIHVVGENGCEQLLPSTATERYFNFYQVIPGIESVQFRNQDEFNPRSVYIRKGEILHYEMVWQPINHGLGRVLYSLALAPCETVRVAIVDWVRENQQQRLETTNFAEALAHDQHRDRAIDESVLAMLDEFQQGESLLGGTAGVGGYGQGSWGVTGSHAIGIGRTSSQGERNVDVATAHALADSISQATNAIRELRSTVIFQSGEFEREYLQTRAVTNHNHCHSLTVLYYEVVRHYRVMTRLAKKQEAIFVDYRSFHDDGLDVFITTFTNRIALKYRKLFEDNILDTKFVEGFSAIERLGYKYGNLPDENNSVPTPESCALIVDMYTGRTGTNANVNFCMQLRDERIPYDHFVDLEGDTNEKNTLATYHIPFPDDTGFSPFTINDIYKVGVRVDLNNDWELTRFTVTYASGNEKSVIYDSIDDPKAYPQLPFIFEDNSYWWSSPIIKKVEENPLLAELHNDRRLAANLIDHLNNNLTYYNKLIWLFEDPDARAIRFDQFIGGGSRSLLDEIDNRILGISGSRVIFAGQNISEGVSAPNTNENIVTKIIAVPTRGTFAEAKLSNCNSCETIDDARFWDWQMSPCPDQIPEISPIGRTDRPLPSNITPSTLPNGTINVTDPQAAPEPSGLTEVMNLLKTPDIFRDMSGIEQLGPLLQKLAEVAGDIEKAHTNASTELQKAKMELEKAKIDGKKQPDNNNSSAVSPTESSNNLGTIRSSEDNSSASNSPAANIVSESPQSVARNLRNAERAIESVENPAAREQLRQNLAESAVDRVRRPVQASPARTVSTKRLSFHFKTDKDTTLRGDYEVIVKKIPDNDSVPPGVTAQGGSNIVYVDIPSTWDAVFITVRVVNVPLIRDGDFVRLREWLSDASYSFFGSSSVEFNTESAAEQIFVHEGTNLFNCVFVTNTQRLTIDAGASLAARLQAMGTLTLAEIVKTGEIEGEISASGNLSVSTDFELITLRKQIRIEAISR